MAVLLVFVLYHMTVNVFFYEVPEMHLSKLLRLSESRGRWGRRQEQALDIRENWGRSLDRELVFTVSKPKDESTTSFLDEFGGSIRNPSIEAALSCPR